MLSPGSKGWINKYFELVQTGKVDLQRTRPKEYARLHYLHLVMGKSGIVFGFPLELIFAKDLDDSKWTSEEKLKLLLFESHLLCYIRTFKDKPFQKMDFVKSLNDFYKFHNARSIKSLFSILTRETETDTLESLLANRVDLKMNFLENKWWVNAMSNAFVYLDIILYYDFLQKNQEGTMLKYSVFAENVLTAIIISAYSDGTIAEKEKDLFSVFLASANLEDDERDKMKTRFKKGATFDDFSSIVHKHWMLKRFLLDISALTIFSNHDAREEEMTYLNRLAKFLDIPQEEFDETLWMVEGFLLKSKDKAIFLKDSSSYEKVYSSLSKRWVKVLMRNKDKLSEELKKSKQLIKLVNKATVEELTKEEKDQVKEQFREIIKAVPALTIFMLPGGTLLLPILIKVLPVLAPSAFRDNQLEKGKKED